jgi:hypothetical protein
MKTRALLLMKLNPERTLKIMQKWCKESENSSLRLFPQQRKKLFSTLTEFPMKSLDSRKRWNSSKKRDKGRLVLCYLRMMLTSWPLNTWIDTRQPSR